MPPPRRGAAFGKWWVLMGSHTQRLGRNRRTGRVAPRLPLWADWCSFTRMHQAPKPRLMTPSSTLAIQLRKGDHRCRARANGHCATIRVVAFQGLGWTLASSAVPRGQWTLMANARRRSGGVVARWLDPGGFVALPEESDMLFSYDQRSRHPCRADQRRDRV
jgi:hypothetical protein